MSDESIDDYALGSAARLGLSVLAHKWTLLIVVALKPGPLRFSELRRRIPDVTAQVLTEFVAQPGTRRDRRTPVLRGSAATRGVPAHRYGSSMCAPATAIRVWGEEHGPAIADARRRYDPRDRNEKPSPDRLASRGP